MYPSAGEPIEDVPGGSNAKQTSSVLLRHAPFVYVACSSVLSTTFHDSSRIQLHVGAPRCEGRGGTTPGVWAICKNILLFLCFQLPLCMLLAPSSYQLHFTKTPLESSSMWVPRGARGEGVQLPGVWAIRKKLLLCCYVLLPLCTSLAPSSYQLHFTKTPFESSSTLVPRGVRGEGVQLPGRVGNSMELMLCYCFLLPLCLCLLLCPFTYTSRQP